MINTAIKHIRRSPYQALTAILIMTITFFVASILVVLAYASSTTLKYYETKPQVIAYFKKDATDDQVGALHAKLEADSRVERVRTMTREDAWKIYKEATANNPLITEFVSPKILPPDVEFGVKDLSLVQTLINEVQEEPGVDEVAFSANLGSSQDLKESVTRLTNISKYIRLGGVLTLTVLLFSSLLVLLVIIGMRISSRKDEIEILGLLGATPGFIRGPFVLEGIYYAVVGTFIGWFLALILTVYLSPSLVSFFETVPFLPKDILSLLGLFGIVLAGEMVLAILLGITGSLIAIKRYLKI